MKHYFVSKILPFVALSVLLLTNACDNSAPPVPTAENLVGTWTSHYMEQEGLDVTNLYKMTLKFRTDGFCEQKLTKPGGIILTAVQPYQMDYSAGLLSPKVIIGQAEHEIEKFELGHEMILIYAGDGIQPPGFIQPWRAIFHPW